MKEICCSANRSPKSEDLGFLCYALVQLQKALERATERAQIEHKRKNIKRMRGGNGTRDEIKEELLAFTGPKSE